MLEWFVKISNTCKDVNITNLYHLWGQYPSTWTVLTYIKLFFVLSKIKKIIYHLCQKIYNYYKTKNLEDFKNEFPFLSFEKTMKEFYFC
jgi:hypothetical protein